MLKLLLSSLSLPKFLPTPIRLKEKLALLPAYWDGVYTVFRLVFPFTKLVPTVSLAPISLSLSCALKVTREPISISPHSFDHRKSRKKVFFFFLHMAPRANYHLLPAALPPSRLTKLKVATDTKLDICCMFSISFVSFIPFLFLVHNFWRQSYKNTKILHNLCLHFARQDGQDQKKTKRKSRN